MFIFTPALVSTLLFYLFLLYFGIAKLASILSADTTAHVIHPVVQFPLLPNNTPTTIGAIGFGIFDAPEQNAVPATLSSGV